ncbi:hypothetical protein JXB02_05575 [Candidatus Woesearchaeota archaeon]|nr:hypothetical protein [Candidatus Woesearchaeota archaeon]
MAISYRAQQNNFRLTDFAELKEAVVEYRSVKNIPDRLKRGPAIEDQSLSLFL